MSIMFLANSVASQVDTKMTDTDANSTLTSAVDAVNKANTDISSTSLLTSAVDTANTVTSANVGPVTGSAFNNGASDPSSITSLASMFGGLVVVLLIIFFLAYLVKRFNLAPNSNSVIKTIAASPLGQKEKLMIVEVQGRQYLLGVTPHQVNLIDKLDTPIEQQAESFASRLRQAKSHKS